MSLRSPPIFIIYSIIAFSITYKWVTSKNKLPKEAKYLAIFSAIGTAYIALSYIAQGWNPTYLFDEQFILRQSYFVVIFPVITIAAYVCHTKLHAQIKSFFTRHGTATIIIILISDIYTAWALGSQQFMENNGYTYYLEKSTLWLIFGYVFYCKIASSEKKLAFILFTITSLAFLFERLVGYGTMFNAATGIILYAMMALFYASTVFNNYKMMPAFYISGIAALALLLFAAPFTSELFVADENTYWRLETWKENLKSLIYTYGMGVGFGTSYFPATAEAIDYSYRAAAVEGSNMGIYDNLFIRGQHSSPINIAFRTGILGIIVFFLFIASTIRSAVNKRKSQEVKFLTPLFMSGLFNISLHVGLESPPFCVAFSLATGFLLSSITHASSSPAEKKSQTYQSQLPRKH